MIQEFSNKKSKIFIDVLEIIYIYIDEKWLFVCLL